MMKGTPIFEPLLAGPEDNWDIPLVSQGQVSGGIKVFDTESKMNAWSAKYPSRRANTIAIVIADDADSAVHTFRWNGSKFVDFELGTQQIPTVGISFVNPDGSTTTGIELLALNGLELEGNEKDGFTLKATKSDKPGGVTFEERHSYAEYSNISRVLVGPYLELNSLRDKPGGPVTGVEIGIKPNTFELHKTPGYLAYMQYPELVYGKAKDGLKYRKGTLWFDLTRVSPEGFLQIDRNNKAIGLQDVDISDDPNVSGGSKFLVWPFIYLEGDAPADGYVELIWYKKSDGTIATDINGHPMAIRHNYKQGDKLTPLHAPLMFAQVQAAKGLTEYSLALVDSFDEYVKVNDYAGGPSGICIQELTKDGNTSLALTQAEADTGFSIRAESYYLGTYLASIGYLTSIAEPAQVIKAGSKASTVAGIEMYAVRDTEYAVNQGMIEINSSGNKITDFYIGLYFTEEETRMIAGKSVLANLALQDKDDAWNIGFFTYDGDWVTRPPIYSSRNNDSIVLNKGWTKVDSDFISEDAVSGIHSHTTPNVIIPKNANNVMVAIYPVSAQSPCDLYLRAFHIDAAQPESVFDVNEITIKGLQHLDFMTNTVRMFQGINVYDATLGKRINTSFAALRYTDGPGTGDGIPMPFGVPQTPLKYLTLDKSINVISGSQSEGGEGALVASEQVEVSIYQTWQLYNELAAQHEAEYWLMVHRDGIGQDAEVPNSRTTFSVDSKRPGVDYFTTNKVTVTLEPGDYIYAKSSSDVKDGAYAQTMQSSKPLCVTYITEKYLG